MGVALGTVITIITAGAALPVIPVLAAIGRDITTTHKCDCVRYDYRVDDTCKMQNSDSIKRFDMYSNNS